MQIKLTICIQIIMYINCFFRPLAITQKSTVIVVKLLLLLLLKVKMYSSGNLRLDVSFDNVINKRD